MSHVEETTDLTVDGLRKFVGNHPAHCSNWNFRYWEHQLEIAEAKERGEIHTCWICERVKKGKHNE